MTSGYLYGNHEPTENCPYCGTVCRADFVDVGIGYTQCGPYHCENCGASEIGAFDEPRPKSAREKDTGWYEADSEPGSSANVIGGRIVSHVQAQKTYQQAFEGNPLWEDKAHVDDWWAQQRKASEVA